MAAIEIFICQIGVKNMNLTKNIKIRILAFMMAFWLAFSVTYNDYQEVEALEWAIPVIGFDTAIKFLLGLLGVSLTSKALHDNVDWGQVRQNCIDYQIQQGNDAVAVGEWWEDVIHGTLNQASDCWTSFKKWVHSLFSNDIVQFNTFADALINVSGVSSLPDSLIFSSYDMSFGYYYSLNDKYYFILFTDGVEFDSLTSSVLNTTNNISGNRTFYFVYNTLNGSWTQSADNNNFFRLDSNLSYYFYGLSVDVMAIASNFYPWGVVEVDNPFQSANSNIQDTALTNENATTDAIPGALPLPWDNVSDTAEGVADAIDALQEAVAEGVLSLEDYWQRVQDLVGALAIDTTTDEVLPNEENPDTGENETIQDKVLENTSNGTFTLAGMEKVFPFCIPWDIYAFVTLLVANPVAPKISYPFYNPVTKQNINIEIDFADWETVVVLFRYILDFLLIIGLLLLARSLSGAGGDD